MDKSASNQPSSQARSTLKSYGSAIIRGKKGWTLNSSTPIPVPVRVWYTDPPSILYWLALSLRRALLLVRFPDKGMLEGIGFNPPSGLGGAYIEIGLNAMPLKCRFAFGE
ncbi:hypothetical protein ACH5RR_023275 [Cinchona calisaya]|uniref:Uncharacterized protein n=1 Tax=Cinchona calisaya TaxID=153742 RepID=A0ABD2ZA88_9GENT